MPCTHRAAAVARSHGSTTAPQATSACTDADAALASSQWESARKLYEACLAADPNNFGALSNMGVVLSRLGRMQEAVDSYQKALALSKDDPKIEFNLAVALVKSGNCNAAVDHLSHLQEGSRDLRYEELLAFCYYRLGSYSLAARAAERVHNAQPDDPANALILGSAYTRLGLYQQALPLITLALKAAGSAEGHLIMAETLLGMHQYRPAFDELNQAAELQPDLPDLHTELGVAYVGMNKPADAILEFTKALEQDPTDYQANYYMGRLKRLNGDFALAQKYLQSADRLQPGSTEVMFEFAAMDVSQQHYAEAVPLLEKVIRQEPDHAEAYLLLSVSYARTGHRDLAQTTGETYNKLRKEAEDKKQEQSSAAK
jgi:tetratricopeptide (TPR) repeat protein